ncbi:Mss4-like protein [Melampsora americana]|nr:Mss4-like protein [Melampsora americana]
MIHGKCHCGEITFTAEEVSMKAGLICHCTTCRTMTSSFSYNLQASAQSIKINHGQPKVYEDKSSDSGKPVYRNFCGDCGTALFR